MRTCNAYSYAKPTGHIISANISGHHSSWAPGVVYTYTYFYNHARRLRLENYYI
jgi:hypothetical protein